jgi:hypothetical protein
MPTPCSQCDLCQDPDSPDNPVENCGLLFVCEACLREAMAYLDAPPELLPKRDSLNAD